LGPDDPGLVEFVDELARCRFRAGRLEESLRDHLRLVQLQASAFGATDPRVAAVQAAIDGCKLGLRQRHGSAQLIPPMTALLRQARSQRAVDETSRQERIRTLARRLLARGRVETGARLLQHWLTLILRADQPVDEEIIDRYPGSRACLVERG
jgi:hypothetical protein